MLPKGTILHGNLRVDEYLSSGGFGNTYVVTHTGFDKRLAVKEFFMKNVSERDKSSNAVVVNTAGKVDEFNSQLEKFKKEARRLFDLDNEHIVKVHELFDENNTAYYVMDYIEGESLAERIQRTHAPMTEPQVMDVLTQVLDALRVVHSRGLWHLDIKPGNIMMDRQGKVKLIDFGASKQLDADKGGAAATSVIAFTMGYAPIEQMDKMYDRIGPWTDFYALGATLFHLLTGNIPPYPSEIVDDESVGKQSVLPMPQTSEMMRSLIVWMMNPSRSRRPQSVAEIQAYLNQPAPAPIQQPRFYPDSQTTRLGHPVAQAPQPVYPSPQPVYPSPQPVPSYPRPMAPAQQPVWRPAATNQPINYKKSRSIDLKRQNWKITITELLVVFAIYITFLLGFFYFEFYYFPTYLWLFFGSVIGGLGLLILKLVSKDSVPMKIIIPEMLLFFVIAVIILNFFWGADILLSLVLVAAFNIAMSFWDKRLTQKYILWLLLLLVAICIIFYLIIGLISKYTVTFEQGVMAGLLAAATCIILISALAYFLSKLTKAEVNKANEEGKLTT